MSVDHDCPLTVIDTFVSNRYGTYFEAEIFASLVDCPFVIRAFEFALADGALYATENAQVSSATFSERFWTLDEEVRITRNSTSHHNRILVPFDIKSSLGSCAENHVYITTVKQRTRVGFYIAVCAANPNYVEVFPNQRSGLAHSDTRKVAVNLSRKSYLPSSAYGSLSPCNGPYRMPLALLPQALESLQRCARGQGNYVNPWTLVQFPGWKPHIERGNDILIPAENSQHYTSFKGVMEIWRCIRIAKSQYSLPIDFELVHLQPRLADFKILVPNQTQPQRRQVFIQYKIDGIYRSPTSPLDKVAIARNSRKGRLRHYFTDSERFDFLFYQFDYQNHQRDSFTKFFFLPESVMPDEFYITDNKEANFNRDEFRPYWIEMDTYGNWVKRVYDIIIGTPQPRHAGHRPSRRLVASEQPAADPPQLQSQSQLQPTVSPVNHVMAFHQKLFDTLMAQCATHLQGLVVALSRSDPLGDYAYCRYAWTTDEQETFLNHRRIPCTITQLPHSTPVVPFMLYTRSREGTSRGPMLTATEFERLDICRQDRLLIFDLLGQEGHDLYGPLLVVPSDDVRPTAEQRALFKSNRSKDKDQEFEGRAPLLAELLYTRHNPVDYVVSAGGPLVFEKTGYWNELWSLLNTCSGTDNFDHPHSHQRRPDDYRVTVQELHQNLADRHAFVDIEPSFYERVWEDDDERDL